jgi:replication factor A1
MSNILTPNGIKSIQKLIESCTTSSEKITHDSDIYLQILRIKTRFNNGKKITQLDLSDSVYFMPFVFLGEFPEAVVEGDIIYTRNFSVLSRKTALVNKFFIHSKNCDIIGSPINIKEVGGLNNSRNNLSQENVSNVSNSQEQAEDIVMQPSYENNNDNMDLNSNHENSNTQPYNVDESLTKIINTVDLNKYTPLALLSTFTKEISLLIKVSKKYPVKPFQSKSGNGTLFSFNIIDKDGTEMQVTGFTKAVDKFANLLKEGSVYEIKGGFLKVNDMKFAMVKSDYKLMIDENTQIISKQEYAHLFKEQAIDYVRFDELAERSAFSIVDIIGYVIEVKELFTVSTRQGTSANLRKAIIADDSELKLELTLWKEFSELPIQQGDIISVKSAKVGEYQGKSLSTLDTSIVQINPQRPEAEILSSRMLELIKQGVTFKFIVNQVSNFQEITQINLIYIKEMLYQCNNIVDDKFPTYNIKATVISLKHEERNFYPGCNDVCKKKLIKEGSLWRCNACDRSYDIPIYYFTFSVRIKDASGEYFLDFFGQVGEKILNIPAHDYSELVANKQNDRLKHISDAIEFRTFLFTVKPKRINYNNAMKIKLNCYKAEAIDIVYNAQRNIKNLSELLRIKFK